MRKQFEPRPVKAPDYPELIVKAIERFKRVHVVLETETRD